MMNSGPQFKMPSPCAQPWEQMKPTADGRFCEQCSTPVIDFTTSDKETIARTIREADGEVCGRLKSTQLGNVKQNKVGRMLRRFCLAVVLVFGLALFNMPSALASSLQEQRSEFLQTNSDTVKNTEVVIRGTITDKETGEPLPFVNVLLEGYGALMGATTDFDGNYILRLKAQDYPDGKVNITVRNIGYQSAMVTEIPVKPGAVIVQNFELSTEVQIIVGVVLFKRDDNPHSGRNSTETFIDQEDW